MTRKSSALPANGPMNHRDAGTDLGRQRRWRGVRADLVPTRHGLVRSGADLATSADPDPWPRGRCRRGRHRRRQGRVARCRRCRLPRQVRTLWRDGRRPHGHRRRRSLDPSAQPRARSTIRRRRATHSLIPAAACGPASGGRVRRSGQIAMSAGTAPRNVDRCDPLGTARPQVEVAAVPIGDGFVAADEDRDGQDQGGRDAPSWIASGTHWTRDLDGLDGQTVASRDNDGIDEVRTSAAAVKDRSTRMLRRATRSA